MSFKQHEIVVMLSNSSLMVEYWEKFVKALGITSTKSVYWKNAFKNQTQTPYLLFNEILDYWKSEKGSNATYDCLCRAVKEIDAGVLLNLNPSNVTNKKEIQDENAANNLCKETLQDKYEDSAIISDQGQPQVQANSAIREAKSETDTIASIQTTESLNTRGQGQSCFNKPKTPDIYDTPDSTEPLKPLNVQVKPAVAIQKGHDVYPLRLKEKQFALIINNFEFTNPKNNFLGAEIDEKHLKELLGGLGYTCYLQQNIQTPEIFQAIIKWFKSKLLESQAESFVVALLSHGERDRVILSDVRHSINIWEDCIYQFSSKDFPKIPKIFIVDACQHFPPQARGEHEITDTIICMSTLPGRKAYMKPNIGSWFIYQLTGVLMHKSWNTDLATMLREVEQIKNPWNVDQTPHHLPINFKKFYFYPGLQM